jgi:hypothetical protein
VSLPVYTAVLAAVHALAEGDHLDVPTPDGFRMVLRDVDAASGADVDLPQLWISDLLTGGTFITLSVGGLFLQSNQWQGRQAFTEGSGFRITAHVNSWDVRCTGYLFAL